MKRGLNNVPLPETGARRLPAKWTGKEGAVWEKIRDLFAALRLRWMLRSAMWPRKEKRHWWK